MGQGEHSYGKRSRALPSDASACLPPLKRLLLLLHSCACGPSRITPDMLIFLALTPGALKDAVASARAYIHLLPRALGNSLKWANQCSQKGLLMEVFSNRFKGN